jgi:hypothetical protein
MWFCCIVRTTLRESLRFKRDLARRTRRKTKVFFTSWQFCSGSRNAETAIQYLKLADRSCGTGREERE